MTNPTGVPSGDLEQLPKSIRSALEAIECLMNYTTLSDIALALAFKARHQNTTARALQQVLERELRDAVAFIPE